MTADYGQFLDRGKRWRQLLPNGRYAWPLYDWVNHDGIGDAPLIGHLVYWKHRNGRLSISAQALTPEHKAHLRANWQADENGDREYHLACIVDDPARYAGDWGKHSGHCGLCGRALTDPHSRERGIGPECVKKV